MTPSSGKSTTSLSATCSSTARISSALASGLATAVRVEAQVILRSPYVFIPDVLAESEGSVEGGVVGNLPEAQDPGKLGGVDFADQVIPKLGGVVPEDEAWGGRTGDPGIFLDLVLELPGASLHSWPGSARARPGD